jgi:hypothetical protein
VATHLLEQVGRRQFAQAQSPLARGKAGCVTRSACPQEHAYGFSFVSTQACSQRSDTVNTSRALCLEMDKLEVMEGGLRLACRAHT